MDYLKILKSVKRLNSERNLKPLVAAVGFAATFAGRFSITLVLDQTTQPKKMKKKRLKIWKPLLNGTTIRNTKRSNHDEKNSDEILRHTPSKRINHWLVVIAFVFDGIQWFGILFPLIELVYGIF